MYWNSYLPFTYKQRNGLKQRFAHPYNKWDQTEGERNENLPEDFVDQMLALVDSGIYTYVPSNTIRSPRRVSFHLLLTSSRRNTNGRKYWICLRKNIQKNWDCWKLTYPSGFGERSWNWELFLRRAVWSVFCREESLIFTAILYQKQIFRTRKAVCQY